MSVEWICFFLLQTDVPQTVQFFQIIEFRWILIRKLYLAKKCSRVTILTSGHENDNTVANCKHKLRRVLLRVGPRHVLAHVIVTTASAASARVAAGP